MTVEVVMTAEVAVVETEEVVAEVETVAADRVEEDKSNL
jgi:hypothetical protein